MSTAKQAVVAERTPQMQQVESLGKRLKVRGQWMQIGLASATLLAPMAKRWRDLRALERARELRGEAEARFDDVRERMWQARPTEWLHVSENDQEHASGVNSKLWLAGAAVGLVAAGTCAYFLVRRRMTAVLEEPMVDLATVQMNGHGPALREVVRPAAPATEQAPTEHTAQSQPANETPAASAANNGTAPQPEAAPAAPEEASEPPRFIGNIHTMVYHDADAANLPAAENQIFFSSEEEAEGAGFHRDREEAPPAESETPQQS